MLTCITCAKTDERGEEGEGGGRGSGSGSGTPNTKESVKGITAQVRNVNVSVVTMLPWIIMLLEYLIKIHVYFAFWQLLFSLFVKPFKGTFP